MSVFGLLIVPLPYSVKRKLFTFISENPLIAKLQYGLKVRLAFTNASSLTAAYMTVDYLHLHIDSLHRQRESCLQRANGIGQDQEELKVCLCPTSKPSISLTSNQLRRDRRLRPHGSSGPQILLTTQHVPLRLHPFPFPHPQPHLRDDSRHAPSRRKSQALRR